MVELTGTGLMVFPEDGITRGDLVEYYRRVASVMLPHLVDRPLVLEFFPEGLEHSAIWQREVPDDFPDWIMRADVSQDGQMIVQCVCDEPATLLWLADQGCISFYPWLSRIDLPEQPDRMIFDLDPCDDRFDLLIIAAQELREFLKQQFEFTSYAMTTGTHGLHVVVPLDRSENFDAVGEFAKDVAQIMAAQNPELITLESEREQCEKKVFLGTNRNIYNQTMIGPYCVRALEGAPVARPIFWSELDDSNFNPKLYGMKNVSLWLDPKSDPWSGMTRHARSLREAKQILASLMTHTR
jgi:bifunctional non-homologous end joining protein LigD